MWEAGGDGKKDIKHKTKFSNIFKKKSGESAGKVLKAGNGSK